LIADFRLRNAELLILDFGFGIAGKTNLDAAEELAQQQRIP
jgi:hypothetical protein